MKYHVHVSLTLEFDDKNFESPIQVTQLLTKEINALPILQSESGAYLKGMDVSIHEIQG